MFIFGLLLYPQAQFSAWHMEPVGNPPEGQNEWRLQGYMWVEASYNPSEAGTDWHWPASPTGSRCVKGSWVQLHLTFS